VCYFPRVSALLENARLALQGLSSDEKLLLGVELIDAACGAEEIAVAADAWDEEIRRRVDEIRSGKAKLVPWETVLSETNRRFGWDK
jgi:putative addiction module component (TIGR02574 family)